MVKDKVTVLMTTYNEGKDVFYEAIESIINQTYKKIKVLIIVDNKNNKDVINTIKKFKEKDDRISYVINEENLGLAKSLNKGIELVETEYIARMDADDVAVKNRLELQIKYAEENKNIDLFGANICYIDFFGKELYKRNIHTTDFNNIKQVMKYMNIFHHPTFFGKTEIFKKYKYRDIKYSQDYDFICRLLEDNCYVGNMNEYLVYYRLPKEENKEKLYNQRISYYCIQEKYNEKCLNKTDIKMYIDAKLQEGNKKNIMDGFKFYDKAMQEYKEQKYCKFFINMVRSSLISKYQRMQIKNIIKYNIVKDKK